MFKDKLKSEFSESARKVLGLITVYYAVIPCHHLFLFRGISNKNERVSVNRPNQINAYWLCLVQILQQHSLVLINYHIYHKSQLTHAGNRMHGKWF